MLGLLCAFLVGLSATVCGREAVRAARLGEGLGAAPALLTAIGAAVFFSTLAAYGLGEALRGMLQHNARQAVSAGLLLVAAVQIAVWRAPPPPREPTRSFAAIVIVLTLSQSVDAARLLLVALLLVGGAGLGFDAAGLGLALGLALGLGSGTALFLACHRGSLWERQMPLPFLRKGMVFVLVLAAVLQAITLLAEPAL